MTTDIPVIGVDPGIVSTALAWGDGEGCTEVLKPKHPRRLYDLHRKLCLSSTFRTNWRVMPVVVIEDLPPFGKSVAGVQQLGFAHGVTRFLLESMLMPYATVAPTTLKKYVTGSGVATKDDMLAHAREILDYRGKDHNVADAMWLRDIGLVLLGQRVPHPGACVEALSPIVKNGKVKGRVNDWPFPVDWSALTGKPNALITEGVT